MILIYTPHITPRVTYIANYIFYDILKVSCEITQSKEEFGSFSGPKINYSSENLDAIKIPVDSFLLNKGIISFDVSLVWDNGIPLLFPKSEIADVPFDVFSAVFYMISRYEEYLINDRDKHGRFQAVSSIAYKNGFLEMPVVDIWAYRLKSLIETKYPGYNFPKKQFRVVPTIDVDIAYAYKGRGFLRTVASSAKNIFDISDLAGRWRTLILNRPDPFDTYSLFKQWHDKYNLRSVYFFHVGNYGGYDGCLSLNHPLMRNLIKELSSENEIGIHPSYRSNSQLPIIKREIELLESAAGRPISQSRQHFLKFNISQTYPVLDACGIKEEYSMGYAEIPGFRAGTCTPFNFYNLNEEKETSLKIFPFTFMDANWIDYLKAQPADAIESMKKFVNTVKNVDGNLITIWHNHSLSGIKSWKDWQIVYPSMLEMANLMV
jgi:hypothetical protein